MVRIRNLQKHKKTSSAFAQKQKKKKSLSRFSFGSFKSLSKVKNSPKYKSSFNIRNMVMIFVFGSLFGIICTLLFISIFKDMGTEYSSPTAFIKADFTVIEKENSKPKTEDNDFKNSILYQNINNDFIPEEPIEETSAIHEEELLPAEPPVPISDTTVKVDVEQLAPLKEDKAEDLSSLIKEETENLPEVKEKQSEVISPTQTLTPQITPNNWEQYAVKTGVIPKNAPLVAVIIDDLGIDKKRTSKIIELPAPLTVSFITYANKLEKQIKQAITARKQGQHTLLAHHQQLLEFLLKLRQG